MMVPRWDILSVRWNNRPLTTAEYLVFSKKVLQALVKFDPMLNKLVLWGGGPIEPDSAGFERKVFEKIYDHDRNRVYHNPDPANRDLTMKSTCISGFTATYSVNDGEGTGVRVVITAGASDGDYCLVNLEFSRKFHPQFYEYGFMQSLMKLLLAYCDPQFAFVISDPFWEVIELPQADEGVISDVQPVGWFTYVADPHANDLLPADVEREVLPKGGVLISLQQEFPSEDDPAAVAAAIRIRDALQTEDLLRF